MKVSFFSLNSKKFNNVMQMNRNSYLFQSSVFTSKNNGLYVFSTIVLETEILWTKPFWNPHRNWFSSIASKESINRSSKGEGFELRKSNFCEEISSFLKIGLKVLIICNVFPSRKIKVLFSNARRRRGSDLR